MRPYSNPSGGAIRSCHNNRIRPADNRNAIEAVKRFRHCWRVEIILERHLVPVHRGGVSSSVTPLTNRDLAVVLARETVRSHVPLSYQCEESIWPTGRQRSKQFG